MNRYPLWKYLLVLFMFIAGLGYTLPNFYGESPAVQVLPLRANLKADDALLQRISGALQAAHLSAESIALDPTSVKARFSTTDNQLKAKDILQAQLGDDYMVALNLLSRSPLSKRTSLMSSLPSLSGSALVRVRINDQKF